MSSGLVEKYPDKWKFTRIGSVAEVNHRSLPNSTDKGYCIKYIDLTSVKEGKIISEPEVLFFSEAPSRARRIINKGDVLMSTVRPNLLGYLLVEFTPNNHICSTGFAVISPKENVSGGFLYQNLFSSSIQTQIRKLIVGSNYPAINSTDVKNLKLPLPPFLEQQKIAEILSTVDAKIENIEQQIKETEQLKKGMMQRLLTQGIGHTEFKDSPLGRIPKSWEVKKLGEVLAIGNGKDYKHLNEGEIPVYGTGGLMTKVDDFLYDGESVGIGRKGTIDKPVFLTGKFWTVDTLFYTKEFSGITPHFVYLLFQGISWKKYNEATGVPSLSKTTIESITVPVPPIKEQTEIAELFISIDKKTTHLNVRLKGVKELKKGLMQKLLTGQIRVKTANV